MIFAKSVEEYLDKSGRWKSGLTFLRNLIYETELEETFKWGGPCYTLGKKNVVGLGGFKEFISIWFYQGVFLSDPHKKLVNAQEGTTRGLRQLRYSSLAEIEADADLIRAYILEAIQNQKEGKEIKVQRKKELILPEELKDILDNNQDLNDSFKAFTLSKQRDFADYIATAKQEETKQRRLEKIIPMIEKGVGLNDQYQKK